MAIECYVSIGERLTRESFSRRENFESELELLRFAIRSLLLSFFFSFSLSTFREETIVDIIRESAYFRYLTHRHTDTERFAVRNFHVMNLTLLVFPTIRNVCIALTLQIFHKH